MKKIMFNDRYGLTGAVLRGDKTMTRRIIKGAYVAVIQLKYEGSFIGKTADGESVILPQPAYKIGKEVAIAQPYKNVIEQGYLCRESDGWVSEKYCTSPGYRNKMFVKAEYMPHRIRITGIKVERLQDISDEDCLREGVYKHNAAPDAFGMDRYKFIAYAYNATPGENIKRWWFQTPREAFAALIDRISGRGTWQRNPWAYAYTFELTK